MITLENIDRVVATFPANPALETESDQLTWEEYSQRVRTVLPWLETVLDRDDATVVIEARASIPVFILTSALATLGVPWVALDPSKSSAIRNEQKRLVTPQIIVSDDTNELVLHLVDSAQVVKFNAIPAPEVEAQFTPRPFRSVGFTSGTTGTPKLVLRSRPSEGRRNAYLIEKFSFGADDRFLLCLPLSHASGHGWARTFLLAGATVVIGTPEPARIASQLVEDRISASLIVPPMLSRVLDAATHGHGQHRVASNLRFLLTGGRHVSSSLVGRTLRTFGPVLHSYYGTTETGVNAIATPTDFMVDPRTSGTVLDGSNIRIVSQDGSLLEPESPGRVIVSSYMNADRYHSGPIPTIVIDNETYTVTADTGYITESGELRILGRSSDAIAPDACGDLIGLEEDAKLLSGIVESAVMVNSESLHVDVFLVYEAATPPDLPLLSYLVSRLATQRGVHLPTVVRVVPEIRFNSTGKFDYQNTLALH